MAFTRCTLKKSGSYLSEDIYQPLLQYHKLVYTLEGFWMKILIFRHFFEPDATENNKIPVVNKNLSSEQVLFYFLPFLVVLSVHVCDYITSL